MAKRATVLVMPLAPFKNSRRIEKPGMARLNQFDLWLVNWSCAEIMYALDNTKMTCSLS